jgi:S-adenosylmethionine hydrolase
VSRGKRFITLLTDFGEEDSYIPEMKGVILSINPEAEIVQTTQKVKPGNIRQGAYLLGRYFQYYPEGTVHLSVVDPGVGTERSPVLVETRRRFFVGPDNGLLSYVLREEKPDIIIKLTNEEYQLPSISQTFHGRDLFAPVAAYLSLGVDPREFGPELREIERIPIPEPELRGDRIEGEIVHVDHFGNAVTNIPFEMLPGVDRFVTMSAKGKKIDRFARTYQEGKESDLFIIVGSGGTLEISSFGERAATKLDLSPGDKVEVTIAER